MKRNPPNPLVPVVLCLCQILFSRQTTAQTVLVKGTVSTSTSTVRYASVSFKEEDNPTVAFSALTDSAGRYQLQINLTSVEPSATLPAKFELEQNYPESVFVLNGHIISAQDTSGCQSNDIRHSWKSGAGNPCRISICRNIQHTLGWQQHQWSQSSPRSLFLHPPSRR